VSRLVIRVKKTKNSNWQLIQPTSRPRCVSSRAEGLNI